MTGAGRLAVLLVLVVIAALALQLPDLPSPTPGPPPAVPAPAPLASRGEREPGTRALSRALLARRPLLTHLPIRLAGVTIAAAGPAGDGRTRLTIRPGPRGRGHARALYDRTLRVLADSGDGYEVRWLP